MNKHSDKLQAFKDTRFGWSATLRIDFYADYPFVVRVRDESGVLRYRFSTLKARIAKERLEKLLIFSADAPRGMRGNWWTVKGNVCDID